VRISKYFLIVCIAFLCDFLSLIFIDFYTNFSRVFISSFTYLLGTMVSYLLMKKYVFTHPTTSKIFEIFSYFFSAFVMSLIIGLIFFTTELLGIENIIVQKIIASAISFTSLFVVRKFIIFRKI